MVGLTLPPMRSSLGSPGLQTVSLSNNTDTHCMTPTTRLPLTPACMCALHACVHYTICWLLQWSWPAALLPDEALANLLTCGSLFRSTVHALACTLVVWDMSCDLWSPAEEKHGCVRQSGRRGSHAPPPHALRRRWLVILRKVGQDSHEPTSGRTPAILSAPLAPPESGRATGPGFWSRPFRL